MLKTRVITAIVLLAVFLPALFFLPQSGWAVFVAVVVGVGGWEWGGFMQTGARCRIMLGGGLSAVCLVLLACFPHLFGIGPLQFTPQQSLALHGAAGVFWIILVPFWLGCKWRLPANGLGIMAGLMTILPAWVALVQLRMLGPWALLAMLAIVWIADSAAYFFGRMFGKHKLAVRISPGKTWEGAIGGGVAVLVYGLVMRKVFGLEHSPVWLWLVGLPALTILSIMGDLFESLLKRQAGLKDSSNVLPGHGGVLDRVDSLNSTLPVLMLIWLFSAYL